MARNSFAAIQAIQFHVPDNVVTNAALAAQFPEWGVERVARRTGILERHIASAEECSSDLAVAAARKLFDSGACRPGDVDFVLLCTQSPDYFLPTTACLVQDRLGLPVKCGALDFNLGHSGYIYGLGLAKGLVETGQADKVLLITAETYSKYLHPEDKSVRLIFGDAAAVTLVAGVEGSEPFLGPFVYGTDGSGAENLIVATGAMRHRRGCERPPAATDAAGNVKSPDHLFMNGGELFSYALQAVPNIVSEVLRRAGKTAADIDLFVFHQANRYILEQLGKAMKLPAEKVYIALENWGNTVSSTVPIALHAACAEGRLRAGSLALLAGFGVGYSCGATLVRWRG